MSDIVPDLRFYGAKRKWPKGLHVMPYLLTTAADEITRLRTALSEAEQRARREALEEAAKVTDARAKEYEDEARDLRGSEQDRRFCASVAFRLRATASAIRALIIPSEPHDAEGRE